MGMVQVDIQGNTRFLGCHGLYFQGVVTRELSLLVESVTKQLP